MSSVWKFYTKLSSYEALCDFCSKTLKTGGGTTNLHRHLRLKHPQYKDEMFQSTERVEIDKEEISEESDNEEYVYSISRKPRQIPWQPRFKRTFKPYLNTSTQNVGDFNEIMHKVIKALKDLSYGKSASHNEEDEFGKFGKFIANQLRNLPTISALEIQEKFYSILTKERISLMKNANKKSAMHSSIRPQHQQNKIINKIDSIGEKVNTVSGEQDIIQVAMQDTFSCCDSTNNEIIVYSNSPTKSFT